MHGLDDLFAKHVFIADVGGNTTLCHLEGRLRQGATMEVSQRDIHHVHKPLKAGGDEFAERHQMMLVVVAGRAIDDVLGLSLGADQQGAVGVAQLAVDRATVHGDTQHQIGLMALSQFRPAQPEAGFQAVLQHGNNGFRQNNQARRVFGGLGRQVCQLVVTLYTFAHIGAELGALIDIALHQAGNKGRAMGLDPGNMRQTDPDQAKNHGDTNADRAGRALVLVFGGGKLGNHGGAESRQPGQAIHTHNGCPAGKHPFCVGVADIQPRKAGQQIAAQPFAECPAACPAC